MSQIRDRENGRRRRAVNRERARRAAQPASLWAAGLLVLVTLAVAMQAQTPSAPAPKDSAQATTPAGAGNGPSTVNPPSPAPLAPSAQKPNLPAQAQPDAAANPADAKPQVPGNVAAPAPSPEAANPSGPPAGVGFRLENADLLQFINLVATQLRMNYVVDPQVKGSVTISTAGDLGTNDLLPILETVLRLNGATAVQAGNFFRIVPLASAARNPLSVSGLEGGANLPKDDQMMMKIIPLRFVFAGDMAKMLSPFLSEGGTVAVHEAGNILILVDDSLNVRRLMDILAEFDSPAFVDQRVRLVPVHNSTPSALVPQLEAVFAAYALSAKQTPLRFVPLDQINAILVAAANPSAFDQVERWVEKLDQQATPTGMQTFVYRVQNSEATYLVRLLRAIRRGAGEVAAPTAPTPTGVSSISGNLGPSVSGGGLSGQGLTGAGAGHGLSTGMPGETIQQQQTQATLGTANEPVAEEEAPIEGLHLVADTVSNSIIFQGTAQQYAEIASALKELDVIPRQVIIDARVYEVDLTGDLSFGVEYVLQQRSNASKQLLGSFTAANNLQASVGAIIGQTRELLMYLNAEDNRSRVRMLSAPSILATDSSEARIQVGASVPVLTSQAVIPGIQVGSTSLFSNTVTNVDTGVILSVIPRITSTGMVSLSINQEVSQEQPLSAAGIQSPSFLKREIATHAVVPDGQTIALGGIIQYSYSKTTNRIPLLGAIPGIGGLFGSTDYQTQETELIVLITPRIISNISGEKAATQELRDRLGQLKKDFKNDTLINP